jgi:hypothetical protein
LAKERAEVTVSSKISEGTDVADRFLKVESTKLKKAARI